MKRYVLFLFLLVSVSAAIAQPIYDFGKLVTGTVEDAKYLAGGYIAPAMKAFGYGINNGWYNSSAPHKLGGFDLTLTNSSVFVPVLDQTYVVDNAKMTQVERVTSTSVTAPLAPTGSVPTAFGSGPNPIYRSPKGAGNPTVNGPSGVGIAFLPTPALGLGIGLPKGFELRVRYVPTMNVNKYLKDYTGSFGLFGVGVMHDIKQWIPGVKALPFDISAFVGYTKLNFDLGIDSSNPNNKSEFACQATTIQALVGKKLSILTVYGSVGYNIAKTDLAVKGTYNFNGTNVTDPFVLATDSNGLRATLGLRIRLAIIAFHGDYSFQKYNAFTAGFGINFR